MIEPEERALIHSIIEFGDTVVREVMVPRPDMVTIEADARSRPALEMALAAGCSRLPVYGRASTTWSGIAYIKDLMRAEREGQGPSRCGPTCAAAHFVPETKRVAELCARCRPQVPPGRSWSTSTAAPPAWSPWRT